MKIAIVDTRNPGVSYREWESILLTKIPDSEVSLIISGGARGINTYAEHLSKFKGADRYSIILNGDLNDIPTGLFNNVGSLIIVAGLRGNTTQKYIPEIIKQANIDSVSSITLVATIGSGIFLKPMSQYIQEISP